MNYEEYSNYVRKDRANATVVLKVTNKCPLRCKYCYHFADKSLDVNKDMPIELVKEAILKLCPPYKQVHIHIHGGEPLSLPNEQLEEIFKFINDYKMAVKDYQSVFPAVQTNLLFFDDEKKELLKKYEIGLSTSFDGICSKETRNIDVEAYINKLNNVDNKGVINVVTNETISHFDEQMETFDRLGNTTVMSNAVFPFCCPDESKLRPGEYADYIIKRFEYQLNNDKPFSFDTIRYFATVALNGKGVDCFCSLCLNSIFTVDVNGNIKGCDVRYEDIYQYGNISEINNVYDIFQLEGYQKFEKATFEVVDRCQKCEYFNYCHGGCFNRVVVNANKLSKDFYCYDIKIMIDYFIKFFEKYDNKIENLPEKLRKTLSMSEKYAKEK